MNDFLNQLPEGIATELISNVIWIIIAAIVIAIAVSARRRLIWWYVGVIKKLVLFTCASSALLGSFVFLGFLTVAAAGYAMATLILGYCVYLLLRFRRLGITDVFASTVRGIDYSASLKKPQHSFDFLGVGAHKLTSAPEFREMVKRCAKAGRPVRLLLSHPDNPVLRNVASRAGIDRNTYASRVRDSLKIVAELAKKEGFNVVVRFYHAESDADFQQFRLVFIDDRICIMSYTIWDDQEGRSNPQVLLNAGHSEAASRSLYYTFKDYFERIWGDARTEEIDLAKYR